jgi:adenylate kinase family enzyme
MTIILIAGGPRSGKTTFALTLAREMRLPVRHTDDLIGKLEWSASSEEVSRWLDGDDAIIEGVAVGRAVAKWLARNPSGTAAVSGMAQSIQPVRRPCDRFYWAGTPRVALSAGQVSMFAGCRAKLTEIMPELKRRGVAVEAVP